MSLKKTSKKASPYTIAGSTLEPMTELISNREAVVEGCAGIVEYNDTKVSINCKKTIITFEGSDINLRALSSDIVEVTGIFSNISFS